MEDTENTPVAVASSFWLGLSSLNSIFEKAILLPALSILPR